MSKKSRPNLYSKLLNKLGQDFLDREYKQLIDVSDQVWIKYIFGSNPDFFPGSDPFKLNPDLQL